MKAKKYRLQTVLEIRARTKDEAARMLALRLQLLEQAEAELVRRRMKLQACYEQQDQAQGAMNQELRRGIQANKILSHQNFLNDLKKQELTLQSNVDKQVETVLQAEIEVEKAREKLAESARDLKSIEVHKTHWQSAEQKAEDRREQKISDEIGAILHGRPKI